MSNRNTQRELDDMKKEGSKKEETCVININQEAENGRSDGNDEEKILQYFESKLEKMHPGGIEKKIMEHDQVVADIFMAVVELVRNKHLSDAAKSGGSFLLVGMPGNGKTTILSTALQSAANFSNQTLSYFVVSPALIDSMWVGKAAKNVKALFDVAEKNKPTMLFFDEVDCLMAKRGQPGSMHSSQLKTELLTAIDGIRRRSGVMISAATCLPYDLDDAFVGRFKRNYFIGELSGPGRLKLIREEIFLQTEKHVSQHHRLNFDEKCLEEKSQGFSGRDIVNAIERAKGKTSRCKFGKKMLNAMETYAGRGEIANVDYEMTNVSLTLDDLVKQFHEVKHDLKSDVAKKMDRWVRQNCNKADDQSKVANPISSEPKWWNPLEFVGDILANIDCL